MTDPGTGAGDGWRSLPLHPKRPCPYLTVARSPKPARGLPVDPWWWSMSAKRFSEPVPSDAGPRLHREARSDHPVRNPGIPLDLDIVRAIRVNRSAVERRAATIPTRRTVKKQWQAAWLLRAITLIDLTTLSGDDTPGTVRRLCGKARRPLRPDLLEALGVSGVQVGAVCVYHAFVATAVDALRGPGIPVA